jgi:predicted transcriptional regulator
MHRERSCESECGCIGETTVEQDAQVQDAVLGVVLDQHLAALTTEEIAREFGDGEGDRIERAIRDLVAAGLLRREGESVLPTRAAIHFDSLRP